MKPKRKKTTKPEKPRRLQTTIFDRLVPKIVVVKLDLEFSRLATRVLKGLTSDAKEAPLYVTHPDVKQVLNALADELLKGEKAA